MKRIVLIIAAAMLALSVPQAASAQKARDLIEQVLQAQAQGRGNDRGDRGRRNDDGEGRRGPPSGESWRPSAQQPVREISMSQAIRIVEQRAGPGHHLDGSREDRGGRTVYRIQWVTDRGERRDYVVDGQTGAVIGGR
jgi:uncharacterized membrane protein YkoI